jgi:hypothetical protein
MHVMATSVKDWYGLAMRVLHVLPTRIWQASQLLEWQCIKLGSKEHHWTFPVFEKTDDTMSA